MSAVDITIPEIFVTALRRAQDSGRIHLAPLTWHKLFAHALQAPMVGGSKTIARYMQRLVSTAKVGAPDPEEVETLLTEELRREVDAHLDHLWVAPLVLTPEDVVEVVETAVADMRTQRVWKKESPHAPALERALVNPVHETPMTVGADNLLYEMEENVAAVLNGLNEDEIYDLLDATWEDDPTTWLMEHVAESCAKVIGLWGIYFSTPFVQW